MGNVASDDDEVVTGHDGELPIIEGTLIRLTVDRLPGDRNPKPLWLWASRPEITAALMDRYWQGFLRRFDVEHTFRFAKQTLGSTRPRIRSTHPYRGDQAPAAQLIQHGPDSGSASVSPGWSWFPPRRIVGSRCGPRPACGGVCPRAAFNRVKPVFETFSKVIIHTGEAGTGQYGKLFNNAVMMMNQQNLATALAVATELNLPLAPLLEVLRSGSARSFALEAFGLSVSSANAEHLERLELIDIDLFATAVADVDSDSASRVTDWAVAGASGLVGLTATIEAASPPEEQ
ncbi:NAD-binding protein [Nocardia sp. NPDC049220]|uniref:NAD-binding protein n=1 Tax=Nocardia sp. NPDC049220 TaxID=3155273 RepID=UPI0033E93CE3